MALNLGDAWEWIDRARQQNQQLDDVYREWVETAGIVMLGQRDPQYMLWEWDVAIAREPSTNLSVIAGEVFDALRRALDYVAWQIYVEGSAEKSEKQNRRIYFPIVTDPDKWERELANKVPGASDECIAALRASQPFAQQGGNQAALPALAAFINSDKHRRLSLFASAVFSVSAIQPDLGDDLSMGMAIMHPPPTFHISEAIQQARESGYLMPSWLVAFVELRRGRDSDAGVEGDRVPWTDGVKMADPGEPELSTGFGTEDGDLIGVGGLVPLTEHVAEIVERFDGIG